jgi:hypothetical protein
MGFLERILGIKITRIPQTNPNGRSVEDWIDNVTGATAFVRCYD